GSRGARGGDVRLARRVALSLAGSHRPGGPPAGDGRGRSRQRGTPLLEPPAAALDPPAALDLPGRGPALPDVAGDGVVLLRRLRPERRGRIGGGGSGPLDRGGVGVSLLSPGRAALAAVRPPPPPSGQLGGVRPALGTALHHPADAGGLCDPALERAGIRALLRLRR